MAVLNWTPVLIALAGLPLLSPEGAPPPPKVDTEFRVKAAYLFNFARFVEWPARAFKDQRTPYVFAVLGEDPFQEVLDETFRGKTINGRELMIKRFPSIADLEPCHVLFVGRSEKDRLANLARALEGQPVLTVSDLEGFARSGGVFRFFIEDKKVRFEVNIDAAHRAELKISAKLLQVGVIVRDPSPEEAK